MTRKEIHIKSVLTKKGYEFDRGEFGSFRFSKCHWKLVEPKVKKTYLHVIIYINAKENKAFLTMFTDFTIKNPSQLEKYYIVFNRVKYDLEELGLNLI